MSVRIAIALLMVTSGAANAAGQTITLNRTDYANDSGARGIVAADFDGDGRGDLATANTGKNTVTILLNKLASGGGFVKAHSYVVGAGPFDIAAADVNRDGRIDLVVAAADANRIEVLLNSGSGSFTIGTPVAALGNPRGVALVDVNGDRIPDLIYTSYNAGTVSVMYGDGRGAFPNGPAMQTGLNPQGTAVGDFNGDGFVDFAVANAGSAFASIFTNSGSGGWARSDISGAKNLNVLTAADFNRDGRIDLAGASTAGNIVTYFLNSSTGLASYGSFVTGSSPRGIAAADLNGDGFPELITANRSSNTVTVILASASPTVYNDETTVAVGAGSRTVAVADFDHDGFPDVAVGDELASIVTVLMNRISKGGGNGSKAFELHNLPPYDAVKFPQYGFTVVADFNHNGIPDVLTPEGVIIDGKTPVKLDVGSRDNEQFEFAAAGDFNGDGNMDFARTDKYIVSRSPFRETTVLDVYLGDGHGAFMLARTVSMKSVEDIRSADLNHDGFADLVLFDQDLSISPSTLTMRVLLGHADATFTESDTPLGNTLRMVGVADMNRDGKPDLVMYSTGSHDFATWLGNGNGTFTPMWASPQVASNTWVSKIADMNEDGIPDVIALDSATPSVQVLLVHADGSFGEPITTHLPGWSSQFVPVDLTGDGHMDLFTDSGLVVAGNGDGTFGVAHAVANAPFFVDGAAVDFDHDGLTDVVISTYAYAAMVLYNRSAERPNLAPIANTWPHSLTFNYRDQFEEDGPSFQAFGSYDPNLDPVTYEWRDESGKVLQTGDTFNISNYSSGAYKVTLVVTDNRGAHGTITVPFTVLPFKEINLHAGAALHGAWVQKSDSTAADELMDWHPNANAPKVTAPLASPTNYLDFTINPDPTQVYKFWLRLRAENNSWANDSVYVQFEDAVDATGNPVAPIGTTSGLSVNLEECNDCGVSGWGWRDEAWGTKGAIGTVTVRFPAIPYQSRRTIRIQTREDGVMIDQIVLSSEKYKSARPGSVKNDNVILPQTDW